MDAGAAAFTTYLPDEQIVPYPETLVQQRDVHPAQFMGDWMASKGCDAKRIGFESDVYFLTPACVEQMKSRTPNATWEDCGKLVNWQRLTKSPAELTMLSQAAAIAGCVMQRRSKTTRQSPLNSAVAENVITQDLPVRFISASRVKH